MGGRAERGEGVSATEVNQAARKIKKSSCKTTAHVCTPENDKHFLKIIKCNGWGKQDEAKDAGKFWHFKQWITLFPQDTKAFTSYGHAQEISERLREWVGGPLHDRIYISTSPSLGPTKLVSQSSLIFWNPAKAPRTSSTEEVTFPRSHLGEIRATTQHMIWGRDATHGMEIPCTTSLWSKRHRTNWKHLVLKTTSTSWDTGLGAIAPTQDGL